MVSELWKELRKDPSIGRGNGPPRPPRNNNSSLAATPSNDPPNNAGNLLRTINPQRASASLIALSKQKKENIGKMIFLQEGDLAALSKLPYTPGRGDNSHVVVFLVKNVHEYREAIKNAAKNKVLINKQVILLTCGDSFVETTALRESILDGGALMVWTTDRLIVNPRATTSTD